MEFSHATTCSERDWRAWIGRNVEIDGGSVTLRTSDAIRRTDLDVVASDVAVDASGGVYALRADGSLHRIDPTTGLEQRIWRRGGGDVDAPTAVCAGENRVYVADGADGSIVVVSTRLQRAIGRIETDAAEPTRLGTGGGLVYLLDGDGALITVGQGEASEATVDWELDDPVDFAVDGDGRAVVIDRQTDGPRLRVFRGEEECFDREVARDSFETAEGDPFDPIAVSTGAGVLVAGERRDGTVSLFALDERTGSFDERYVFDERPRRLVSRSGRERDDLELFAITGEDGQCRRLAETRRHARDPETDRHTGLLWHRYDSGEQGTEWHRISLEVADEWANTQVRLRYVAADDPSLVDLESIPELSTDVVDVLGDVGIETAWDLAGVDTGDLTMATGRGRQAARSWQLAAKRVIDERTREEWLLEDSLDTTDVLLRSAEGRYLFVNLELVGGPQTSPRIEAVRAYCPRTSYLRYLPDLYREDDRSAAFLERFLSVFESEFVGVEEEIEEIGRLFDPGGVPAEHLEWLGEWLGASPPESWPEGARRELLARAPELYKKRGTKEGIRALIDLYLRHATDAGRSERGSDGREESMSGEALGDSDAPDDEDDRRTGDLDSGHRLFFLEHADVADVDRPAAREQYTARFEGRQAFAVYCGPFERSAHRREVERIVEENKPAHVSGSVVSLEEECALDGGSYLGINSRLATRSFTLGDAALGSDAMLHARPGRTR